MTDDSLFWCDVCGRNDDAPHTPIDHPWLLRGHRLIPEPKVKEMLEAAVRSERERIIDVIANVPITITFVEPVTEIDVYRFHADIIKAITKGTR